MQSFFDGGARHRSLIDIYIRHGYDAAMDTITSGTTSGNISGNISGNTSGTAPNAPLTPAVFHILLALSNGERHGYGIMKQVEADTEGKVKMGPGTLYGSLKRMLEAGLVAESDRRVDPEMDDERRIYYKITAIGMEALEAEVARYRRIVTLADARKLLPQSDAL